MGLDSFVHWLLYSSLMGSVLIGLITIIRWGCKNRLGANWQYILWLLLIIRLLIPFAPESDFSVFNIFHHFTQHYGDYFMPYENVKTEPDGKTTTAMAKMNKDSDDYYLSVHKAVFPSREDAVFLVWLIGVICFSGYMMKSTKKLQFLIKNSFPVKDRNILETLEECRQLIQVNPKPVLIESSVFQSPKAVGLFQPYIILPAGAADSFAREKLRYVFLHELAHFRRKDLYVNWVIAFVQILHWFNPLIWYALYQMRQDRELACDAAVLNVLHPEEYKHYGNAMIAFLEKYSVYPFTTAGVAGSKKHLKDRMLRIVSYQKKNVAGWIGGAFLFLLLSCFVLTNAKEATAGVSAEDSFRQNQNIAYKDLSNYFQEYDGAFVLLDLEKKRYLIYNHDNSEKRVSPNSTYKIISSLVGLGTGVLKKDDTRLEWDGTIYPIELWNKDQTLNSAMAHSANWYFQRVDFSVGKPRIENYLQQIGYGNHDLSGGIQDFWIESSLKISPQEQVEMLKKLCTYDMPFSQDNIDLVKNAIKIYEQDHLALYGKTGTGSVNGRNINGWFVGFVEKDGRTYIFATNIQGKEKADGANAKNITLSILREEQIL